jgi:hypothetical protein
MTATLNCESDPLPESALPVLAKVREAFGFLPNEIFFALAAKEFVYRVQCLAEVPLDEPLASGRWEIPVV